MEQQNSVTSTYYPSLHGLRFIAAMLVVWHHFEQLKMMAGLPNCSFPEKYHLGYWAVSCFFVLSGFLITHSLWSIQYSAKTIKTFYFKRIRRIWPLYYISFVVIWAILYYTSLIHVISGYEWEVLLGYLLLAPNIIYSMNIVVPFLSHFWSIGVEEQFYLLWPWIIRLTKKKGVYILTLFILLFSGVRMFLQINELQHGFLFQFLFYTRIDQMGWGAFAFILFQKNKKGFRFLSHPITFISSFLLLLGAIFLSDEYWQFSGMVEVSSLLLAMIIGNLAYKSVLENPILVGLGKISYSIYMWHPILLYGLLYLFFKWQVYSFTMQYVGVCGAIILASWISYRLIEKPFLKLGHK